MTRSTSAVTAYFRTRLLCRNLRIRPETCPITVRYPSEKAEVTVTFVPLDPVPGELDSTMEATVLTRQAITGRPGQDLQVLAEQHLPAGSRVEPSHLADPQVQRTYFESGCPSLDVLPLHLDALFTEVHRMHNAAARRTVQLLRWRYGFEVPTQPFALIAAEWSLDQETWQMMSVRAQGRARVSMRDLGPSAAERVVEVQRLLDAGCEMPVGNELLAEAEE